MKTRIATAVVLLSLLTAESCLTADADDLQGTEEQARVDATEKPNKKRSLTFSGDLTNYFVSESHAYFGDSNRSWLETSGRIGAIFTHKDFTLGLSAMGLKTTGRDPYGTGSAPTGAPEGTPAPGTRPAFYLDKAYLQLTNIAGSGVKVTVGRQPISIGSQFVIGDGVYDGFASGARQAVYHNPRKSFDAIRVEWDLRRTHFDSFIYRVDPTWDGGGKRDGLFGGLVVLATGVRF